MTGPKVPRAAADDDGHGMPHVLAATKIDAPIAVKCSIEQDGEVRATDRIMVRR
jgi:hypothetical protein